MKLVLAAAIVSTLLSQQTPTPNIAAIDYKDFTQEKALSAGFNRSLLLEPGIKAVKSENGYFLSTYDGSKLELQTATGVVSLSSPVSISLSREGWNLGSGAIRTDESILARRALQDDTDSNLKSMQESAKKLKTKSNNNQDGKGPQKKLRVRWLYGEDPNPTAELFNTAAIQQLTHLSPIGF